MQTVPQQKYQTTNEANEELYKILHRLNIRALKDFDFGYERYWNEDGTWLSDNLTVYKGGKWYETTMSPEKFESMTDKGKSDFINYLMKQLS